jgi:hypothetical protein
MARWRSTGREASRPPPEPGRRRATGPPARRHIHAGHDRSPRSALPLAHVLPGSTQRLIWPLTPRLRKHVRGVTPSTTTNRDRPTRARFAPTSDLCAPASQDQTWLLQADLPIRHQPESVAPNPRAAPDRAITAARRSFTWPTCRFVRAPTIIGVHGQIRSGQLGQPGAPSAGDRVGPLSPEPMIVVDRGCSGAQIHHDHGTAQAPARRNDHGGSRTLGGCIPNRKLLTSPTGHPVA